MKLTRCNYGTGWVHMCQGCGGSHVIPDTWTFDNNFESPTFTPSVRITWGRDFRNCCHYFIKAGNIEYQGDCTHSLAGQTLPLSDLTGYHAMTARGIRNNNPGNIRHSGAAWQGAIAGPDTSFVTFKSMEWGVRALAKVLLTYQEKYGLKCVRQIIGRWAPPVENNTGAYIDAVSKAVGVGQLETINLRDRATLWRLVRGIINHENGADGARVSSEQISLGVALALN